MIPISYWPLYVFPHEELVIARKISSSGQGGPHFVLLRDLDKNLITADPVSYIMRQGGGGAWVGPSRLYSEYWLPFLSDMILPENVRFDQSNKWISFRTPHVVDHQILERMKTIVPAHMEKFRSSWEAMLEHEDPDEADTWKGAKVRKLRESLADMMDNIVRAPFASPIEGRHKVAVVYDLETSGPQEFQYIVSIDRILQLEIRYYTGSGWWEIFRVKGSKLAEEETLSEAWESMMEDLNDQGVFIIENTEYDSWLNGLEQGEELVDLSIYEALSASNPLVLPDDQFVQWMKAMGHEGVHTEEIAF